MGCITSRGDNWPPRPYKRIVVRDTLVDEIENGEVKKVRVPVEDYVWVYPGAEIANGCGGPDGSRSGDDASPLQESVIRKLEDG